MYKNKLIINCWIDYILKIFPNISENIALLNVWEIKIDLDIRKKKVIYDEDFFNKWQQQLNRLYGLLIHFSNENIDSFLSEGIPIIIVCDKMHIPYHTYSNIHTNDFHLILIYSFDKKRGYYIYDDMSNYEGYLDKKIVKNLWHKGQKKLFWVEIDSNRIIKKTDELKYIHDKLNVNSVSNRLFIDKLVSADIDNITKMHIIINLKEYIGLFNSLLRILYLISCEFKQIDMRESIDTVETYVDAWKLIFNIANKGVISNNELIFNRIKMRFEKILEYEKNVNKVIENIKYNIISELLK